MAREKRETPNAIELARVGGIIEGLRALSDMSIESPLSTIDQGNGEVRELAKRLRVPFLLIAFVEQEFMEPECREVTPADVEEFQRWGGHTQAEVADLLDPASWEREEKPAEAAKEGEG